MRRGKSREIRRILLSHPHSRELEHSALLLGLEQFVVFVVQLRRLGVSPVIAAFIDMSTTSEGYSPSPSCLSFAGVGAPVFLS